MSRDEDRGTRRRVADDDEPRRRSRGEDDAPRRSRDDDNDRPRRSGRDDDGPATRRTATGRAAYEYHGRTREEVDKRSTMGGRGDFDKWLREDIKIWAPNDGDNTIRPIQSFWDDPKRPGKPAPHYGLDIFMHYGVGPDRQSYLCPLKHGKGECPICEERDRVVGDDEEYARTLAPKRRVLFYLIDRDHEREGPQAWAAPYTVDQNISKISVDKKSGEVLSIDHAYEGYDVEFHKSGQKERTKYTGESIARRQSELGDESWLDYCQQNPLPDALVFFDYETIRKAFGGGGEHRNSRDRDRDDERGRSNGRDSDHRDDPPSRRSRDDEPPRRSSKPAEPELDWEGIHAMTGREMEDLIEQEKLNITPDDARDDDELADWICEEMKISKPRRRAEAPAEPEDDPREKLRKMRESRGDRQ